MNFLYPPQARLAGAEWRKVDYYPMKNCQFSPKYEENEQKIFSEKKIADKYISVHFRNTDMKNNIDSFVDELSDQQLREWYIDENCREEDFEEYLADEMEAAE